MAQTQIGRKAKLIAIGGSAGSLQVILYIIEKLPSNFQIPIVLILHRDPQGISRLTELLAGKTQINVKEVEDKDVLENATIYICPPDYHLLIEHDLTLSLDYSEKINFSRPSIDVTFKSAADVFGPSLTTILLSGANADGADGIAYSKDRFVTTIVQDPDEADVSYMPKQAILSNKVDHIFNQQAIAKYLSIL